MDAKRAHPETQLDVDMLILNYLLYTATKTLLDERRAEMQHINVPEEAKPDLLLQMVDSYLAIFKAHHPTAPIPTSIRFRLQLLKFTTLFARRLTSCATSPTLPTLHELRQRNANRARSRGQVFHPYHRSYKTELPVSSDELERNRDHALRALCIPPAAASEDYYGTEASLALADLLPSFMALSAARSQLEDFNVTTVWMKLAAQFMLQSALEQYLIYGASGFGALDEAFIWGYQDGLDVTTDGDEVINALFRDGDLNEEVEGWRDIKTEIMQALIPPPNASLIPHLETVATRYPIVQFEAAMLGFLEDSHRFLPAPTLAQLEFGRLNGLSTKETEALKQHVKFY